MGYICPSLALMFFICVFSYCCGWAGCLFWVVAIGFVAFVLTLLVMVGVGYLLWVWSLVRW